MESIPNTDLFTLIKNIYFNNHRIYGARRIYEMLRIAGVRVSYSKVFEICHKAGFVALSAMKLQ